MKSKINTIERRYQKNKEREIEVLENIADMLVNKQFQEELKHSDVPEIESKVQAFLA